MAKPKAITVPRTALKCDCPPDEALRRAMLVPVPDSWKVSPRKQKKRAK